MEEPALATARFCCIFCFVYSLFCKNVVFVQKFSTFVNDYAKQVWSLLVITSKGAYAPWLEGRPYTIKVNSVFKTMDKKPYTSPKMRLIIIQTEANIAGSFPATATGSEGFQEEDWD